MASTTKDILMAIPGYLIVSYFICTIFSIIFFKEHTLMDVFYATLALSFLWMAAWRWTKDPVGVDVVGSRYVDTSATYLTPKQTCQHEVRAFIEDNSFMASHEHIMMNSKFRNVRFIAADESNLKIIVGGRYKSSEFQSRIVSVDDVLGVHVLEDGKDAIGIGNTLGMAAIGGLMFGEAGAIIGAISGSAKTNKVSNISLVIAMDDLTTPFITLVFLTHEADKNTAEYKEAHSEANKWAAIINILISRREKLRIANETKRYEKLLP